MRNKKLMYVLLGLHGLGLLGVFEHGRAERAARDPKGQPAKPKLKDVNIAGNPKAPGEGDRLSSRSTTTIASSSSTCSPCRRSSTTRSTWKSTTSSPTRDRRKWATSGLQCAGVFVNGKSTWDVLRRGKEGHRQLREAHGLLLVQRGFGSRDRLSVQQPEGRPRWCPRRRSRPRASRPASKCKAVPGQSSSPRSSARGCSFLAPAAGPQADAPAHPTEDFRLYVPCVLSSPFQRLLVAYRKFAPKTHIRLSTSKPLAMKEDVQGEPPPAGRRRYARRGGNHLPCRLRPRGRQSGEAARAQRLPDRRDRAL